MVNAIDRPTVCTVQKKTKMTYYVSFPVVRLVHQQVFSYAYYILKKPP